MSPTLPDLVDSHCHLDFPDLVEETAEIVARARAAGVSRMVTICTRLKNEPRVRAIAEAHPEVYYAAGTHPMSAAEEPLATVEELVALARHPRLVGIGETGLDYHYTADSKAIQQTSLRIHIEAAQETGLPLIIHTREADDQTRTMLEIAVGKREFTPLLHCYTSGLALAEAVIEMGGYVSFSGIITFKNAEDVRAVAMKMPLDRIIIETDCPYLAPVPFRGRRCEPAHVLHVADKLAGILAVSRSEIDRMTTENFFRLFSKASRPVYNS